MERDECEIRGFAERVLEELPDPVFVLDEIGNVLFANRAAERVLGWRADEWVGSSVLSLVHPDDLGLVGVSMTSIASKQVGTAIEIRAATADGSWRLLEVIGSNLLGDPQVAGIVLCARDLTERRRYEVVGGDAERFRMIVQHSAAITMLVDTDGCILSASAAITRILGHDPELIIGRPLLDLVAEQDTQRAARMFDNAKAVSGTTTFDAYFRHADGDLLVPLELAVVNLSDDPVVGGLIISGHDITPLREAQRELEHLASHDHLTGLPNRALLRDRLDSALARASRSGDPVAVFFVDLDGLKQVNDVFGHEAGDHVLIQTARRIESATRPGGTVVRYGGDEFVIVAEGADHPQALQLAERIEDALAKPLMVGSQTTQMRASVGIAIAGQGMSADELITSADAAMYLVKASRRAPPHER